MAAAALGELFRHANNIKHLDFASTRRLRRELVVPTIRAKRVLTHSSSDCVTARESVADILRTWGLDMSTQYAGAGDRTAADDPITSQRSGQRIVGAAKSDTLDRQSQ